MGKEPIRLAREDDLTVNFDPDIPPGRVVGRPNTGHYAGPFVIGDDPLTILLVEAVESIRVASSAVEA